MSPGQLQGCAERGEIVQKLSKLMIGGSALIKDREARR
ncbi:hypothetical protein GRAN_0623 [Granulicella sibirica]|uniref:Uncharacterized protein n=1 Tax=Granulicella sibirica TaxID=2479048 RepID=A0A4Q0T119_9BACT|nr:hypothetical protein GRAN_0623 [Granulicella sibirica]